MQNKIKTSKQIFVHVYKYKGDKTVINIPGNIKNTFVYISLIIKSLNTISNIVA